MWGTTGRIKTTTVTFTRLVVVPYVVVEWLSKRGQTPNELRVWLEEITRTDVNCQIKYWELLFAFVMVAAHMDPNYKKSSVMTMEVEPVTATYPSFCKWEYQILYATLGTRPTRYQFTDRGGSGLMLALLCLNHCPHVAAIGS